MRLFSVILLATVGCSSTEEHPFAGGGGDPLDAGGGGGGGDDTAGDTADTADTVDTSDTADTSNTGPLVGTGYGVGDTAYELAANTQTGAAWSLYSQVGTPVVLVVGSMYDPAMVQIMGYLDGVEGDLGVVGAALVAYDEDTIVADQSDAVRWASETGVSVVMYDPYLSTWNTWAAGASLRVYLIDAAMVIRWTTTGSASESSLRAQIEALSG